MHSAGMNRRFKLLICLAHRPAVCLGLVLLCGCEGTGLFRIPDPRVAYIAFGDSTTAGAEDPDYPASLNLLIDNPEARVVNEGDGGDTARRGVERLRRLLEAELYPNAVAMLYWQGGNDLKEFILQHDPVLRYSPDDADYPFTAALQAAMEDIEGHIAEAVTLARSYGLRVYVATYFPLHTEAEGCKPLATGVLLPAQNARVDAYLVRLNDRIRSVAAETGAGLVDVAAALGDELRSDADYYADCNHLSSRGNALVAELFLQAIENQP